jgi:hypothetical protein
LEALEGAMAAREDAAIEAKLMWVEGDYVFTVGSLPHLKTSQ